MDGTQDGGLEATEGEIEFADFGNRKFVFLWIARFGCFGDGGAARVGEAKNFGNFVEAFADGVVAGSADYFEIIMTVHIDNLSVSAGDNGRKQWKTWFEATEPVSVNMRFEVMGRIERDVINNSDSTGGECSNEQ